MKSILSISALVFFLFSTNLQAQNTFSNSLDKAIHFKNNQILDGSTFIKSITNENDSFSMLSKFSKDLRSELSSQKWNTILKENKGVPVSMIKVEDKDKIILFGNPLMGFTEKKLVFDEPALFSDTVLVYSF
jgi:hypothetical protein